MAKQTKKSPLATLKARYPHVRTVASENTKGRILRVNIRCTHKAEGCTKDREIATQDAFQVKRCESCQRDFSKVRRRRPAA